MSHRKALSQWERTVSTHLPHLSRPQAQVLAYWSYGMVLAKSCGITTVASLLADLTKSSLSTMRKLLREWCYDAQDKKGEHRQDVDVTLCFAPRLGLDCEPVAQERAASGSGHGCDHGDRSLHRALYQRALSWLRHSRGLETAREAGRKGHGNPIGRRGSRALKGSVPKGWTVIVLADRGLYAPWLFRHIVSLGWHPFLRINLGGKVRPVGASHFDWLSTLVPQPASAWCGRVDCFSEKTVRCTLLARWDEGYADPWLVLTDLAPEAADVVWYSMRSWIEGGGRRYETRRMAMAPDQDDGSRTGHTLMVSHRRGHLMGGKPGR